MGENLPVDEDFDVENEYWNLYQLEDGTILKHKMVLVRVVKEEVDETGRPVYGLAIQGIVGTIPPKELRGEPSTRRYSPKELSDSIIKEDMKFKPKEEHWNRYKLRNGTTIEIKPILTMVSKTDKFDERGEPIYLIQSQAVAKGKGRIKSK